MFSAARFVVAAKPSRLEGVSAILHTSWLADRCTPAQATTLLGKCGFLTSQLQSRVLRLADRPLVDKQHSDSPDITLSDRLQRSLVFIQEAFMCLPPKTVKLDGIQPLTRIYSDAAASETSPITTGWALFQVGRPPRAGAGEVPNSICEQFDSRHPCADAHRSHRILHFVDNQGALIRLIGGSAKCDDAAAVACMYQLAIAEFDARV